MTSRTNTLAAVSLVVLIITGAVVPAAAAGGSTTSIQPSAISETFSPAALSIADGIMSYEVHDKVVTYTSDELVGWYITYKDGSYPELETWISAEDNRRLIDHDEDDRRVLVAAPPDDVGITKLDRWLDRGLSSRGYIETIDVNLVVRTPEEPSPMSPGEFEKPDHSWIAVGRGDYTTDGIAFTGDANQSSMDDVRDVTGATGVTSEGYGVKIGVIDTGANVQDGRIYGNGERGSPVRIYGGMNTITNQAATITTTYDNSIHTNETSFLNAPTRKNVDVVGTGPNADLVLSGPALADSQQDWENGTRDHTQAVATPGTLGLGYKNGTATDDTLGYWRLDRTSGAVVDYSGNGNDGAVVAGTPRGADGLLSTNGYHFDGSSNEANLTDIDVASNFTINVWVNRDGTVTTNPRILSDGDQDSFELLQDGAFLQGDDSLAVRYFESGSTTASSLDTSAAIPLNEWTMYSVVHNGTHLLIYKDATKVASTTAGDLSVNNRAFTLGYLEKNGGTDHFSGEIDEPMIVGRPLTGADISALYAGTNPSGAAFGGDYQSEWHDFSKTVDFTSFSDSTALNGGSVTWEFRSSSDGTSGTATAWYTSISDVPDNRYLQARATLTTPSQDNSPEIDSYSVGTGEGFTGTYVSVPHDVSAMGGWANVTLSNATIDYVWQAKTDTGSWTVVRDGTFTTTGNHTFAMKATKYSQVRVKMIFQSGTGDVEATVHEEAVEATTVDSEASDFTAIADGNGHGSWVASAIAGDTANDSYDGMAPAAQLYIAKALGSDGSGSTQDIIEAIEWANEKDVDILSMSLGAPVHSETLANELREYVKDGGVAVVAVGNARQSVRWVASPADVEGVIGVAATNTAPVNESMSAYFSQVGPDPGLTDGSNGATRDAMPFVAAPGMKITTKVVSPQGYVTKRTHSGTSMATPIVAGSLALLLAEHPELKNNPGQVRARLANTSSPMPLAGETEVGHGMVNVTNLLTNTPPPMTQEEARNIDAQGRDSANRAIKGSSITKWLADESEWVTA